MGGVRFHLTSVSIVGLAVLSSSVSARGAAETMTGRCRVTGGENLPANTGGASRLCSEIARVAGSGWKSAFAVDVKVGGNSTLTATATLADGHVLPRLKVAATDRVITIRTFKRLADAIADHVAKSSKARATR